MSDHKSRLPRPAGEPDGVCGRPECGGRVVQPPKPRTDLPERVLGAQPIRPWRSLAQGLAGHERQAFAALVIEVAGSRSAVEADVFQMPQHQVHGRRPRLRRAADFIADAYGSETAPAGQPSFGHLLVLPRSGVHGDRITGERTRAGLPGRMTERHLVTIQVPGPPASLPLLARSPGGLPAGQRPPQPAYHHRMPLFAVRMYFRAAASWNANEVQDLDNLIKPALDAIEGTFGLRTWKGPVQAADDRADHLEAVKRLPHQQTPGGAYIRFCRVVRIMDERPDSAELLSPERPEAVAAEVFALIDHPATRPRAASIPGVFGGTRCPRPVCCRPGGRRQHR
jgi:hypothetical protein